ncbi:arylsulfotransferase family protein [Dongia deserti]|uniref:arylsulfotransferase family protein n=1 Tax=Dongia deserti TaxID=2268030 RepID=UPI0013C48008|nr:arylsulfotransferase family protein [Dongia deserti]
MTQTTIDPRWQDSHGWPHWLGFSAFLLASGFLIFMAGALVVLERLPPYPLFKSAHQAGHALLNQISGYRDPVDTDLWADARRADRGVTIHNAAKAYQGYTLYTSGHDSAAFLVDMDGTVMHTWRVPFSAVWDESSAVAKPRPDPLIYFRNAYLFPNGDLLALYEGAGDTPYGFGLVKLDKDSNVIWKYLERAHHDVEVGSDGRIYVLTHRIKTEPIKGAHHLEMPLIEDFLVILSPNGKVEKEISLLEAQVRSPAFSRFLEWLPAFAQQDPQHANAVEPMEADAAVNFPFAEPGTVLLSFRSTSLIVALDPETENFVWGTKGPWALQHDPDLLPNGHILLFDNLGDLGPSGTSRVLEFDPETHKITWSYGGTREQPFESNVRSEQQRLPNGNTFVTESDGGRLFEVTKDGEIVWEYINPVRAGDHDGRIPIVCGGQRFAPGELENFFAAK